MFIIVYVKVETHFYQCSSVHLHHNTVFKIPSIPVLTSKPAGGWLNVLTITLLIIINDFFVC